MSDWLRALLGLDEGEVPAGGETHWEFSGMPAGVALGIAGFIVLASLILIVMLYLRERGLRPWQRASLSVLRLGALALVVLILLNPRLLTEIRLERPGKTLLLFDVSASMSQQDEFELEEGDEVARVTGIDVRELPTRAEIGAAAIERSGLIARLREKNRVQVFTFGSEVREISEIQSVDDVPPSSGQTRIGDAVLDAVRRVGTDPVAGVVVVTDGRNNAGDSPLNALQSLTIGQHVPVYSLGIGKAQLPPNYAVDDLSAPSVIETESPVEIEAKIRVSGMPGEVLATLYRTRRGETTRTRVETRRIEVSGQLLETTENFVDQVDREGAYRYTLVIPRDSSEIEWRDNRKQVDVTVANEKRRVLLIAGLSSREYRYARNNTIRDDGVQVSCWLESADPGYPQDGDVVIDRLPANAEELREYDVVVLMDPDPVNLTTSFQQALVEFVSEQNGGLAYVAGEVFTPTIAADPEFGILRSLLPVDLARSGSTRNRVYSDAWRGRLTPRGESHTICRLVDDPEENSELWNRLPPFYFVHPAERVRAAGVELVSGNGGVLLAIQRVGVSEVVYMGSDGFWRWRGSDVGYHERFWGSMMRYLSMGKLSSGTGKMTVETDRDQYREGDQIRITAHLIDGQRRPIEKPRVAATLTRSATEDDSASEADGGKRPGESDSPGIPDVESRTISLAPVAGNPGRYSGLLQAPKAGQFELRVGDSGAGATAEVFFRVVGVSNEWDDPTPDFELLEQLSRASHGRFFSLGEIDDLPGAIPERKEIETLGRRASTIWDSAFMMFLFTGLLVLEWALRKLWRLN